MSVANDSAVGNLVARSEICGLTSIRRVAAMLDLDPDLYAVGMPLPRGWQFVLLGADTPRSSIRSDGFPGLGVPIPELGLPCLLLASRVVSYHADIPIGANLRRTSSVIDIVRKGGDSNPLAVVTVRHELRMTEAEATALIEQQTYVLIARRVGSGSKRVETEWGDVVAKRTVVPDDTMLFQYSALGFNSHRIHLDRSYCRDVEGYPDLVVNGGLTTLLLTEFFRTDLCLVPRSLAIKYHAPLFSGRPMQLTAEQAGDKWRLRACDEHDVLCAEMQVVAETGVERGI